MLVTGVCWCTLTLKSHSGSVSVMGMCGHMLGFAQDSVEKPEKNSFKSLVAMVTLAHLVCRMLKIRT